MWKFESGKAIYVQIADRIEEEILNGVYESGELIPSVRLFAMEAGVNPNTMQHALTLLEQRGLVYSVTTSGRFVTKDQQLLKRLKEEKTARTTKAYLEEFARKARGLVIEGLDVSLSVCKVEDYSLTDLEDRFCFTGKTDEEKSLVCRTEKVPANTIAREDGWKAFRIQGILDFSLVGILAPITSILADHKIGIFAVSTYNTDYVLVKEEDYDKALEVLSQAGYSRL